MKPHALFYMTCVAASILIVMRANPWAGLAFAALSFLILFVTEDDDHETR